MSKFSEINRSFSQKDSNMETQQEPRGSSRYPYPDDPRHHGDLTKAGTKRLFSNRQSRISDKSSDHGENFEEEQDEETVHSGKRHRPSDWPLKSTHADSPPSRAPLRNRNAPNSPSSNRRPSSSQVRPSKFLEGSMNDRVSQKPPTTYIGEEEFLEQYERENADTRGRKMARPKAFTHHSNTSIIGSSADKSEVSRHSGIFRFGKSLAASFNPSNWKIFQKSQEDEETAEQKILRERREKAESMYQELKKTGQFRDTTFGPTLFQPPEKEPAPTKHDSGVEFGHRRSTSHVSLDTSREDKRKGRVFLEPPQLPTGGESHFSQSPSSTKGSARKGNFHFKKPSLTNIRKSTSDNTSNASSNGDHQARRVPSRKDLHKQQKLVKRVSDLEGKLEAARRQLAALEDEPLPSVQPPRKGRQRFVPGAMPSLPSERLLSGYVKSEDGMSESVSLSQIGKAVSMDHVPNEVFVSGADVSEQPEMNEPTRRAPSPPNFDKSLPQEPDTPHDRVMKSVEVEEESLEIDDHSVSLEPAVVVKNAKALKAPVINRDDGSPVVTDEASDLTDLPDLEGDDNYQYSASGKHETSLELSETSDLKSVKKSSKFPVKSQASKPKKRKSLADDDGVFKPTPETESDLSSVKPKRTPKKNTAGNPPRKLQKTTVIKVKTTPPKQRNGNPRPRQLTPGKKASVATSKTKTPGKHRQSASPPPSTEFTGLDYAKPSSNSNRNGKEIGEARVAAYSAIPSADNEDVPPLPKMPAAVRLASGEIVNIAAQNGTISGGKLQHTPSKLTKPRPKRGEKKEDFEWPDDVF